MHVGTQYLIHSITVEIENNVQMVLKNHDGYIIGNLGVNKKKSRYVYCVVISVEVFTLTNMSDLQVS